jgi:hypothetical protein
MPTGWPEAHRPIAAALSLSGTGHGPRSVSLIVTRKSIIESDKPPDFYQETP